MAKMHLIRFLTRELTAFIAVEILGPINESASDFLSFLAKKISQHSGDERETAFLFQRVSALVQRYNKQPSAARFFLFGRTILGVMVTPTIFSFVSIFFSKIPRDP